MLKRKPIAYPALNGRASAHGTAIRCEPCGPFQWLYACRSAVGFLVPA